MVHYIPLTDFCSVESHKSEIRGLYEYTRNYFPSLQFSYIQKEGGGWSSMKIEDQKVKESNDF